MTSFWALAAVAAITARKMMMDFFMIQRRKLYVIELEEKQGADHYDPRLGESLELNTQVGLNEFVVREISRRNVARAISGETAIFAISIGIGELGNNTV